MSDINLTLKRMSLTIIDNCNRKCSFCPHGNGYKGLGIPISMRVIETVSNQLNSVKYIGDVYISGFGEPLLHPKISSIINILSTFNTTIITNGDYLSEDIIHQLFESGLYKMEISLYDPNIEDYIKSLNVKYNIVFRRLCVLSANFNNRAGAVLNVRGVGCGTCYIPFYKCKIDTNGDVLLCDQDWNRQGVVGNVMISHISDIWDHGYAEYRKHLIQGVRDMVPCKTCTINGTLQGADSYNIIKHNYDNKFSRKE